MSTRDDRRVLGRVLLAAFWKNVDLTIEIAVKEEGNGVPNNGSNKECKVLG